jgi:chitin disaccharide deacetylase
MQAGRLLIVNADDYNTGPERNRGIIAAVKNGIVTSISVLTNRPGLANALTALDQVPGTGIGVHLNLTNGHPLEAGVTSLTGAGGTFLPKQAAWRRALLGGYNLDELRCEWSAQIEAFCHCGLSPDHLDGNNHLHVFPGCARICAELAVQFNIKSVRLPLEPLGAPGLCGRAGLKRLFIALLARRARSVFHAYGLRMPDSMYGIAFPRPGDAGSLQRFLKTLPPGIHELMCHPGYRAPYSHAFARSNAREQELRSLTAADVRAAIAAEGIRLISFSDLC